MVECLSLEVNTPIKMKMTLQSGGAAVCVKQRLTSIVQDVRTFYVVVEPSL